MFISEGRQEAERPALLSRQPQRKISSSGRVPTPSIAILPDCVGRSRKPSGGQPEAVGYREVAYAVYSAADSEPIYLPESASHNRKTDRRFVKEDVSDELLLKSVAEGDKVAMHIIFARHRARVFRFIHRMVRNSGIVDDLVSQVFLDVWRSANRFENRARVSTWLLSIARFKAISFLRERAHGTIDQDDVLRIADAGDTPEAALDRKETNDVLHACIDKLSPAHREIIDLFYYREKSVAEVSEILGIPQATVKSRMFYARKRLARVLVRSGFEGGRSERIAALTSANAGQEQGDDARLIVARVKCVRRAQHNPGADSAARIPDCAARCARTPSGLRPHAV